MRSFYKQTEREREREVMICVLNRNVREHPTYESAVTSTIGWKWECKKIITFKPDHRNVTSRIYKEQDDKVRGKAAISESYTETRKHHLQ